nr:MAG TPA: Protein of unknown function (DUF2757) [Caudoviricetes sp.]
MLEFVGICRRCRRSVAVISQQRLHELKLSYQRLQRLCRRSSIFFI